MERLHCTNPALSPKGSINGRGLTSMISLVLLSNQQPYAPCFTLLSPMVGFYINWMLIMQFFKKHSSTMSTCNNLLSLFILNSLLMCASSTVQSTDFVKHLGHGTMSYTNFLFSMIFRTPSLIVLSLSIMEPISVFIYWCMLITLLSPGVQN